MFDGGLSFSVVHVACSSLLLYKHRYMFVASHVNNRIFQLGNAYSIAFKFQHEIKITRGSIRA